MDTKGQKKWFAVLVLCGLVASGCTKNVMVDSFEVPRATSAMGNKPAVTLLRVEDAITEPAYKADPAFLGSGASFLFTELIVPLGYETTSFSSKHPRTELVQSAFMANLQSKGLPVRYQNDSHFDQLTNRDDGHLAVLVRLKEIQVDTRLSMIIPFIVSNVFEFKKVESHVVLECQLLQPGNPTPLWQGTVEGTAKSESESQHDGQESVIRQSITAAVDQFIQKSNIQQLSTQFRNEAYTRHVKAGQAREAAGDINGAMALYGKAYSLATTSEHTLEVTKIVTQAAKNYQGKQVLPEGVRRYGVQAVSLVEQKRYAEALLAYAQALELAPWWPEAHFNQALILASQNEFAQAIPSMKRYLLLAPNAPNARAAQDKIYDWESKAK